jgi:hypothetical protein
VETWLHAFYSGFINKVKSNCHFLAPDRNFYKQVSWFYVAFTEPYFTYICKAL